MELGIADAEARLQRQRHRLADEQEAEAEIDRILARLDREIPEQEARVQRLMERYGLVKKEKL